MSLQPVGHKLPALVFTQACTGLITCKFTVHSLSNSGRPEGLRLLLPATSVIPGFLRFTAKRIDWHYPFPISCQADASRASSREKAYLCAVVYCCVQKVRTFWCEQLCDMGFC